MRKNLVYISAVSLLFFITSCKFFSKDESEIHIPEGVTEEQLQEQRYKFKHDNAEKQESINKEKTDSAIITVYNVFPYQIKDEATSIGEGFEYYIVDVGVDNYTQSPFHISAFTKSCHLTTSDSTYLFSNVSFALKMYSLQTDSSEVDVSYIKKFYQDIIPPKEVYRAKLFAYEVSKEEKDALYFRYSMGSNKYVVKVRDKQL